MKQLLPLSFCALTLSLPTLANENKTEQLHLNTVINAVPIKRLSPKYPKSAASKGQEGWVTLSFVVNEDGSTSDILVEDSSNKVFEKSAIRAVKKWDYKPATMDGKIIHQCKNKVQLDFKLSKQTKAASRWFVSQYKKASSLLEESKLTQAQEVISQIQSRGRWNAYEDLFFNMLLIRVANQENNKSQELQALEGVLRHKSLLKPDEYATYSHQAFSLSLNQNTYSKAIRHFESLQHAYPEHATTIKLTPYYEKVIDLLDSDTPISVHGEIAQKSHWYHRLYRNAFSLSDIKGHLEKLEIRCDNQHASFLIDDDSTWHVPAQWGQCFVYVFGKPDTHFTLIELPKQTVRIARTNN